MSRIIIVISILISFSMPASSQESAEDRTMERLVAQCDGNSGSSKDAAEKILQDAVGIGRCVGFFNGILDASAIAESTLGKPIFCLPKNGISFNQAEKIYLKYAMDHPEQLHQSARVTVMIAFLQAFPCKK